MMVPPTPARRRDVARKYPPGILVGLGLVYGAGAGTAIGVAIAGGPGLALGAALGAGLGIVVGAVGELWRRRSRSPGQA